MRLSRTIIIASLLIPLGVIAVMWFLRAVAATGTASNFQELHSAYRSASPTLVEFHRSTILKQFPFVGPIGWQSSSVRPTVHLTGRVDVTAFQSFLARHPAIDQHFTMDTNGTTNAISFSLLEGRVVTHGDVDIDRSGGRLFSTILGKDRTH